MKDFQKYQAEFTSHIRNPKSHPRPVGVSARRMKVYNEIVFNNMESTLSSCFPVCRRIVGIRRWQRLVRAFLAGHACATPWFRQIPEEFLNWLASRPAMLDALPPFFESLAHYEWIELAVAVSDVRPSPADANGNLLAGRPVLAPALALLEYPYAVHHISPHFMPQQPDVEPTRLLVFRDPEETVRFVEVNAVTARLVQLLQGDVPSGRAALERIALELRHPDPAEVMQFGVAVLENLRQQGAIIGVAL